MQNVQGRQTRSYTRNNAAIRKVGGNTWNNANVKVTGTNVIKNVGDYARENAVKVVKFYNCRAFDSEHEEELNTTSLFMKNWVNAFDLDYDDDLTASAIFMAMLSHARSINDNDDGPSYDTNAMFEVPIYDKYDMFNPFVHETSLFEQAAYVNDAYLVITNDSNIYSDTQNTITNEDDVAQTVMSIDQENVVIMSVIENIKREVECCNTINQETKIMNESLTAELER
nr:hypothetical protein [Tanacetum cinerariifolium]